MCMDEVVHGVDAYVCMDAHAYKYIHTHINIIHAYAHQTNTQTHTQTERFYDSAYTGSRLTTQKLTDACIHINLYRIYLYIYTYRYICIG